MLEGGPEMKRTIIKITTDRKGITMAEEVIGPAVVPDDIDLPLLRVLLAGFKREVS